MDNSKHQKICSLLKKWLRNHGITQEVLATRYKVSQSVISRQLSGKESIPEERIQDIINLTNPPDAEIELMNTLLTGESSSTSIVSDKNKLSRTLVNAYGDDIILLTLLWYWKNITDSDIKKYITPLIIEIRTRLRSENPQASSSWSEQVETDFMSAVFSMSQTMPENKNK